jgi:hypothetical protein
MPRMPRTLATLAAAAVVGLAACSNDTAPAPASDASLAADLAVSAGDAIATDVNEMVGNEQFGGFNSQVAPAFAAGAVDSSNFSRVRTRTCYDDGDTVVACGQGLTASMVITLQLDGFRIGDRFSAIVHRQRHDSISGLGSSSTSRTHNGYGSSQDTTSFTGDAIMRTAGIAASDTVLDLVFNLPHATNPWPVSGQIIRNLDATFTVTGATDRTRAISRRVVVTFPADAEGNVPIQVGTMTCTLNLVTHKVVGCTGS